MDNLELYQEEQRQSLLDISKGIVDLNKLVNSQLEIYKAPSDKVEVSGKIEVNTEKQVEVENLESIKDWLEDLGSVVKGAIKDNSYQPVSEVTVKNLKDAKPDTVKINNLQDIKKYFDSLARAIEDNQPVVNITKQDIKFPRSPKDAIPVRLSDGKSFYEAMASIASNGGRADLFVGGSQVSNSNPVPVDIQDASVTINGDVTVSNEVEVKNDAGNPIPMSASSLPLPTGAATAANQQTDALTDTELRATPVPVTTPVTTGLNTGRKTVTTAGTAVAIASSTTCKWVAITAETDNTDIIVVGDSGVVASLATREGVPLSAGDSIVIPIDNLSDVYIDSLVNGEGVTFLYGT